MVQLVDTSLTVGAFSPSVLLRVARRTGRLEQHGLTVIETPVASSPAQFRSLLAGELDAVLTSPDNVVAYRYSPSNPIGQTMDARIVAAVDGGLGLALYGRPGRSTAAGLAGANFGVDVATSGFAFAMYALAESVGLSRKDYRLITLGSTPKRLEALLAGECDATMLNAGNELRAEQAGCAALVRLSDVCSPYLGTVLAVVGEAHLAATTRLAQALRDTSAAIGSGELDDVTLDEAGSALRLPPDLARRYLERLKHPADGLVDGGRVDPAALQTVVDLRRRYLPSVVDGVDLLADALRAGSGLLAVPA
jgi:ABC-type nitrate/sulfonate/bicarbonate transport system substrate-binding protein